MSIPGCQCHCRRRNKTANLIRPIQNRGFPPPPPSPQMHTSNPGVPAGGGAPDQPCIFWPSLQCHAALRIIPLHSTLPRVDHCVCVVSNYLGIRWKHRTYKAILLHTAMFCHAASQAGVCAGATTESTFACLVLVSFGRCAGSNSSCLSSSSSSSKPPASANKRWRQVDAEPRCLLSV